jgi:hypothetical protein
MKRPKGPETRRTTWYELSITGRAAQEGSLQGALHHRHSFTTRALQTSSKVTAMKERQDWCGSGQGGRSPKCPTLCGTARRKYEGEEPPLCRIGRIVILDARIFLAIIGTILMPTSGWW